MVDDNETNRLVACGMLERLGYSTATAVDGLDALRLLRRDEFDLVLMDCHMPRMDGYEATRAIRGGDALDPGVPVVAMTAHALPGDRDRSLAAGMDDHLGKPVDLEALVAVLTRLIPRGSAFRPGEAAPMASPLPHLPAGTADLELWPRLRVLGTAERAAHVAAVFREDSAARLASLQQAVAAGATGAVVAISHAIAGSAAMIGADTVASAFAAVETAARSDEPAAQQAMPGLLAEAESALASVRKSLEALEVQTT